MAAWRRLQVSETQSGLVQIFVCHPVLFAAISPNNATSVDYCCELSPLDPLLNKLSPSGGREEGGRGGGGWNQYHKSAGF